jgi:hypothetical protein
MPLPSAMAVLIAQMINGEATTDFIAANAYLGVGDSNAVFAQGQTDLQAATNKLRKAMDAGYPTRTGATAQLNYRSTFAVSEANWVWNEWGVFNGASGGTMFNRKVEALGTKPSTQIWQLAVSLTVTAA